MSRNSSAFIQFKDGGHAFIDGIPQDHECNDKGGRGVPNCQRADDLLAHAAKMGAFDH